MEGVNNSSAWTASNSQDWDTQICTPRQEMSVPCNVPQPARGWTHRAGAQGWVHAGGMQVWVLCPCVRASYLCQFLLLNRVSAVPLTSPSLPFHTSRLLASSDAIRVLGCRCLRGAARWRSEPRLRAAPTSAQIDASGWSREGYLSGLTSVNGKESEQMTRRNVFWNNVLYFGESHTAS